MRALKRLPVLLAMAASLLSASLVVASPAQADNTPGCVTATEYARVFQADTKAWVNYTFGNPGMRLDSYYSRNGFDELRVWRKCRSFDGGYGRVGIWFDDYSYGNGMRVYRKARFNPWNIW